MAIERAYVGFGTWFSIGPTLEQGTRQQLLLTVQFLNFGNTPAEIDTVVLAYRIGEREADPPNYENRIATDPIRVFLVKRGEFFLLKRSFVIDTATWNSIRGSGPTTLRLLGYIEYVDRFKRRFRAGFGRVYEIGTETDPNLIGGGKRPPEPETLPFETAPGYNYDDQT